LTSFAASTPGAAGRRTATGALAFALVIAALLCGLLVGQFVANGAAAAILGLSVVLLPVLLWKRPELAPAVIVFAAITIEQFGNEAPMTGGGAELTTAAVAPIPLTAHIPLFHGIGALHLSPADLLLVLAFIICLAKGRNRDVGGRRRSPVSVAVTGLVGAAVFGLVVGLLHHGSFRVALMETRPFVYLGATFALAALLLTSRQAIRAVLWAVVVASGLKAVQGLLIFYSVRHMNPRPEAVLGHEEALVFALFIFLVASLWLFGVSGRLRTTATWLLPVVIAADLANNRRSAWLLLGGGLIALAAVGVSCVPARRRFLWRTLGVLIACSAIYFPAFWNDTGGLAQPARAVRSFVSPDPRDAQSDLYRIQEDANLNQNIRQGGLLGKGFGVPIDYSLTITDITSIDPLIAYVPHNGVLYVLMRMGLLGGIAMWTLLAACIISGCRLAKRADPELAVVGALVVCTFVGYTLMGAVDQGFFFYRSAFVVGALLGLAEAARRLRQTAAARRPPETYETTPVRA
jgi:hypothetical protein